MLSHPQSFSPLDLTLLSSWGFPSSVVKKYQQKGVISLFPWQIECLLIDDAAPLNGRNLLYTAPTRLFYNSNLLFILYYLIFSLVVEKLLFQKY